MRILPLLLASLVLTFSSAGGAVEAFQRSLVTSSTLLNTYTVPTGKVLILEHVIFTASFGLSGEDRELILDHAGSSGSGSAVETVLRYSSDFNTLFRPLKLREGIALRAFLTQGTTHRIYLYGLLVDESDLYASVEVEVKEVEVAGSGVRPLRQQMQGELEVSANRPTVIEAESTDGTADWEEDPAVAIAETSPTERFFRRNIGLASERLFVRFSARALLRDEYPPSRLILFPLSLNEAEGTVGPFVTWGDEIASH